MSGVGTELDTQDDTRTQVRGEQARQRAGRGTRVTEASTAGLFGHQSVRALAGGRRRFDRGGRTRTGRAYIGQTRRGRGSAGQETGVSVRTDSWPGLNGVGGAQAMDNSRSSASCAIWMTVFQSSREGRADGGGRGRAEEERDSGGRERMDRDQGDRKSMDGLGSIRRSAASKICLVMGSLCWWLILWWSLPVSDGSDGVAGGTALDRWPAKQKELEPALMRFSALFCPTFCLPLSSAALTTPRRAKPR
ncbi:hypothetical protein VTN00DRAFT_2292 [Thermoascus crustaceus]|uniref:uncharacterized protein n=1 Tax=Thermoascus crustaceus TaxID=5088 RepID=UPI0037444343